MTRLIHVLRKGVYSLLLGLAALATATPLSGHGQNLGDAYDGVLFSLTGVPNIFVGWNSSFIAVGPLSCTVPNPSLTIKLDEEPEFINPDRSEDQFSASCDDPLAALDDAADAEDEFLFSDVDCSCEDDACGEYSEGGYAALGDTGGFGGGGYGGGGGFGGGGGGGFGGGLSGAQAQANANANATVKVVKVPEPSTYLVLTGMLGVVLLAKRRRTLGTIPA